MSVSVSSTPLPVSVIDIAILNAITLAITIDIAIAVITIDITIHNAIPHCRSSSIRSLCHHLPEPRPSSPCHRFQCNHGSVFVGSADMDASAAIVSPSPRTTQEARTEPCDEDTVPTDAAFALGGAGVGGAGRGRSASLPGEHHADFLCFLKNMRAGAV